MTDIFFSYSSKDRERVRRFHDAFNALGFNVFWDLEIRAGENWDSRIKQQLGNARVAIVFWSANSATSKYVQHEVRLAEDENKLVPVMLDLVGAKEVPLGFHNVQAARLHAWDGGQDDPEWQKLLSAVERQAMPRWAERRIADFHAELRSEVRKRDAAESNERAVEKRLTQEEGKQAQLSREREQAQAETEAARRELPLA